MFKKISKLVNKINPLHHQPDLTRSVITNKNPESEMAAFSIISTSTLGVVMKDKQILILADYKVFHLLNELKNAESSKDRIDDDTLELLQNHFKPLIKTIKKNENELTQNFVDHLYSSLHQQIISKMADTRAPFFILMGENHYSGNSLLAELVIIEIANRYGFKNICIETSAENFNRDISQCITRFSSVNQLAAWEKAQGLGFRFVPLEDQKDRDFRYKQGDHFSNLFGIIEADQRREDGMMKKLLSMKTSAIVLIGADHLRALANKLNSVGISPILVNVSDIKNDKNLYTGQSDGMLNLVNRHFVSSSKVIQTNLEQSYLYSYDNKELDEMVVSAANRFDRDYAQSSKEEESSPKFFARQDRARLHQQSHHQDTMMKQRKYKRI